MGKHDNYKDLKEKFEIKSDKIIRQMIQILMQAQRKVDLSEQKKYSKENKK